jgi:hypothetical protein
LAIDAAGKEKLTSKIAARHMRNIFFICPSRGNNKKVLGIDATVVAYLCYVKQQKVPESDKKYQ